MRTKNMKRRIVVGDVHGEFERLKEILTHAKLIDQEENWAGERSVLIQTGDVIDRGPDSWVCRAFAENPGASPRVWRSGRSTLRQSRGYAHAKFVKHLC